MGITNVNDQTSAYGAAFRDKPIFLMSVKETEAFFNGKMRRNMELWEDTCTLSSNHTYRRQHTVYEVSDRDKGSAFLDLNFLIKDETSSLKGNLSDDKDVDFYNFSIPFMSIQRNYFSVEAYLDMPEGCDYDLTLYDEYGNQVGKAEWDGEGRDFLSLYFKMTFFPLLSHFSVSYNQSNNTFKLIKAPEFVVPLSYGTQFVVLSVSPSRTLS